MDKNTAMLNYIMQCPVIAENPLYFNVAQEKDSNNQFLVNADDTVVNKPFIDGSVEKRYTVTVLMYKSVAYNPIVLEEVEDENGNKVIVPSSTYIDENLIDMSDGQKLIDWLEEQNDIRNFPNFGDGYVIDSIKPLSNKPSFNGVNADKQAPLAQYSIGIQIEYIDFSKQIWN